MNEGARNPWLDKTAATLEKGDILLNDGSTVNLVVVHASGKKVYIDRTYEDGVVRCETVPADTPVAVWRPRGKQEIPAYVEPFDVQADWEERA